MASNLNRTETKDIFGVQLVEQAAQRDFSLKRGSLSRGLLVGVPLSIGLWIAILWGFTQLFNL